VKLCFEHELCGASDVDADLEQSVTLKLDQETVAKFMAMGNGWKDRMASLLEDALASHV
jgi:uncharacterized protein (DUF4415 family)